MSVYFSTGIEIDRKMRESLKSREKVIKLFCYHGRLMDWPNPQDYNEAIQYPSICFSDPELQKAQIELSPIGLPRPITGAFASVYKVNGERGTWAVRCFHSDIPELTRRYGSILESLNSIKSGWALRTEFIEQGIKVLGRWYPIVKMEWADGLPLDRYLAKHGTNQAKVGSLAKQLRTILEETRDLGIAHGDLQHGNILLVGDSVRILDYDGVFVPALTGLKSAELGHANYQHPYRSREHFGSYIDNFPAWLISISLMSLAADPELLEVSRDRECLLFAHSDLVSPYESDLFKRLREHPLEEIRDATRTLIRLLNCPVEFIPFLDATREELLQLPEMDPGEQMRLIEEISETDSLRFLERPQALTALEKLSTTKRGAKDQLGFLFKQASSQGAAMLSSMIKQKLNMQENAARGDAAFAAGDMPVAIESYMNAVEQAAEEAANRKNKAKPSGKKGSADGFDLEKFEDHLNLRLGTCHLLNNNAASAVFHFKNVVQKYRGNGTRVESLDAIVGLIMAYCQHGRERDATALINEMCSWKGTTFNAPKFSAHNLSCTLLGYGNGPLAQVAGLKKALRLVASYFEDEEQYDYASSLYTAARVPREVGSESDLELVLRIGHCHLLNKRPDLAIGFFNIIASAESAPEGLHDRAAVAQAVAFKMMNSRQDVVKAMRSRLPEKLYNCFKSELDGPLGNLEEFGEVICAFAAELGEADLMGGLRMATRLAADNFQRLDEKKTIERIVELLNENKFSEANELATESLLSHGDLRKRFTDSAQIFARNLAACGSYQYAFELLKKYNCPNDIVVDVIEGNVLHAIRTATRQIHWNAAEFNNTIAALEALFAETEPSEDFCQFICEAICFSSDRSDEFLFDVRRLADLIAARRSDGPSNAHVLKMRAFALSAESPLAQVLQEKPKLGNVESTLGKQFVKATRAASVSAADTARMRQLEGDVLQVLRTCSQNNWDPEKFAVILEHFADMKRQRCLSNTFCDKVASILLDHFSQSSGLSRWQKQSTGISKANGEKIRAILNSVMDTFATVPNIDPGTLRKIQRSQERFEAIRGE
jgi:serine/threonine protein kinase